EIGAARALKTLAEHVQARYRRDAIVVHELSVGDNARKLQPGIAASVAGRPDHRRDPGVAQVELTRRIDRWSRLEVLAGEDVVGKPVGGDVVVDSVQETTEMLVSAGSVDVQVVGEAQARPVHGCEAAGERHATLGERRQIDFTTAASSDELQRWLVS